MGHTMGTRIARLAAPLAAVLAFGATPAHAADIGPMFKAGFDWGRGVMVVVPDTSGGPSQDVRTHAGVYVGGGISVINDSRSLEAELSVSYKARFASTDSGSIDWNRIPIDLLAFFRTTNYRFGAGATYHVMPKLHGTAGGQTYNREFKNAIGPVLQIEMLFGEHGSLGFRYFRLDYEDKATGIKYGTDGIGVTGTMTFW